MAESNGSNNKKICCPVERTFSIIGSKWTVLILRELSSGTKRFGQLKEKLHGISPKTLTQRLRELEREGILSRTSYPEIPPRVEYRLTAKGKSLKVILMALAQWGAENLDEGSGSYEPACPRCVNSELCGQCDSKENKR